MSARTVLDVQGLVTTFPGASGPLTAVDGISFAIGQGEVLGLVGESGSGKSITLRSILRLIHPPGRVSGSVRWKGRDVLTMPADELRRTRGAEIAMVFQEPMTALNPVLPVGLQIEESLRAHTTLDAAGRKRRARELMDLVGIPDAERRLRDYPHEYSGGMRQRAMIAIALAGDPELLLADEPTTALDVTIQDQILKLLLDLRDRLGMSVILVTHDLGVVAATCDRMAVMYAGRIVETGTVTQVFDRPHHAYTRGLLGSIPRAGAARVPLMSIEGTPPGLAERLTGCAFAPRCAFATDACTAAQPTLEPFDPAAPDRLVACFRHQTVAAQEALL